MDNAVQMSCEKTFTSEESGELGVTSPQLDNWHKKFKEFKERGFS